MDTKTERPTWFDVQVKQRIATAIVLVSAFLVLVFWFTTPWFALGLSLVVLVGAMEWSALADLKHPARRIAWMILFCVVLAGVWLSREKSIPFLIVAGSIWWLVVLIRLCTSPAKTERGWFRMLAAVLTLVPAWAALVYLHQFDLRLLLALFLIVWFADTGAYFCGRALGKRKLAPLISPGKTIEGVLGGIVSVVVFAALGAAWVGTGLDCGMAWIVICVATALISVAGDLWESKMKRIAGVKDSGALLPGHGGVLDRIDSVAAAAPVFVVGLTLAGGRYSCSSIIGQM